MGHRTIEGTWEEVSRLAHELAGHRVRVTVLDSRDAPGTPHEVQDPILGMFQSDAPLLDDVVEDAMRIREER